MQFPKIFFNEVNTIIFILLGLLLNWLIYPWKKLNGIYLAITYLTLFKCLPDFGQNVLWLSGAPMGIWSSVMSLLFLPPFR